MLFMYIMIDLKLKSVPPKVGPKSIIGCSELIGLLKWPDDHTSSETLVDHMDHFEKQLHPDSTWSLQG